MRKLWMLVTTVVLLTPEIVAQEKPRTTDQDAIKRAVAEYTEVWNKHDTKALSMCYAQDGDLSSATGSMFKGRAEIEKALSRNFSARSKRSLHSLVPKRRLSKRDTGQPRIVPEGESGLMGTLGVAA